MTNRDEHWMALALEAAQQAPALPFGAVLVDEGADALRATGWNRGGNDPTGHGEIDVIQRFAAASSEVDWTRLTLYTTAEPCPLCAAAVAWAGIPRVVYGVSIPRLIAHGWWQTTCGPMSCSPGHVAVRWSCAVVCWNRRARRCFWRRARPDPQPRHSRPDPSRAHRQT